MTRELLAALLNKRWRFTARIDHFSTSGGRWPKNTILLTDLELEGRRLSDHVWMKQGKHLSMSLVPNDRIAFEARVVTYWKRDWNAEDYSRMMDYGLAYPTRVRLVSRDAPAWRLEAYF
jgi:hypothetical protein